MKNKNYSRRDLLKLIGYGSGAAVMLQTMSSMGIANTFSPLKEIKLAGKPKGSKVVVLGAGVAGLVAAYELKKAGYNVTVLESQARAGGRAWSIKKGDRFTDTDGITQSCAFDEGHYFNVGAWRIPYYHENILHYCKTLGITLDPFIQMNFNSYLHTEKGFDGKPQRFREVFTDFNGSISELLAKAVNSNALDKSVTQQEKEMLLEALQSYGALDKNYKYSKSVLSSFRRGFEKIPGGGLSAGYIPTDPMKLNDLLDSRIWQSFAYYFTQQFQQTLFEPRGGMGMIGKAFARELIDEINYNAQVSEITQDNNAVSVSYTNNNTGATEQIQADWCICTLPARILSNIKNNLSADLQQAIKSIQYEHVTKVGVQYNRRFWEEDELIYGGISLTDLPISHIAYPSSPANFLGSSKGVLLNGYIYGENGVSFGQLPPDERIRKAVEYSAQIHPQVNKEFDTGNSIYWSKVPWALGGYSHWSEEDRSKHYKNLCSIDGRVVLAGEHASYMNGWLEGAISSSLDAITRLHKKAVAS